MPEGRGTFKAPVVVLAEQLERHRIIPRSTMSDPEAAMTAAKQIVIAASWQPPVAEGVDGPSSIQRIRAIARSLKSSSTLGSARGREAQMHAARSHRRSAEIEMLLRERQLNMEKSSENSRWSDASLRPPAASTGNAAAWRGPIQAEAESKEPNMRRFETNLPGDSAAAATRRGSSPMATSTFPAAPVTAPARIPRRPQTCSCCSQVRSLGHSKTCPHTNKVCSRCTKSNGSADVEE